MIWQYFILGALGTLYAYALAWGVAYHASKGWHQAKRKYGGNPMTEVGLDKGDRV